LKYPPCQIFLTSAAKGALQPAFLLFAFRLTCRFCRLCRFRLGRPLDHVLEVFKELVGEFLCKAVDDAAAKLRELAADIRIDIIGQLGAAALRGE